MNWAAAPGGRAGRGAVNAVQAGRTNRALVLDEVQRRQAVSRAVLSRATGLTPASISNSVRDLIELRLLRDSGRRAPRSVAPGAPSTLVELDLEWHRVLAVHQGVSRIRIGAADLGGNLRATEELAVVAGEDWESTLARVQAALRRLVRRQAWRAEQVRGVGFGAVGLVDPETGAVRTAPNVGWSEVPVRAHLEKALGWPVVVRNNVHAMAAGERRYGSLKEDVAVYVYVGTGIGSGIVAGGRVFGGAHGSAGEIGHLRVPGGGLCSCGKTGCLETVAAEPAIAARAGIAGGAKDAVAQVVERAAAGDAEMAAVVQWAGRALGTALAQVSEILDPGAIVVNGIVAEAGDLFLRPLASRLVSLTFAARGRLIDVRAARFGRQAGLVGASALALEAFVHDPAADLLSGRGAAMGMAL